MEYRGNLLPVDIFSTAFLFHVFITLLFLDGSEGKEFA